jgi:hypothetical protein
MPGQGVDLEHVLVLAAGHEQIDAERAAAAECASGLRREVEHAAVARGREARGHEVLGHAGRVFGLVVVDAVLRRDLDRAEDAAVEDADVDLRARDEALDDGRVVEGEGVLEGAA